MIFVVKTLALPIVFAPLAGGPVSVQVPDVPAIVKQLRQPAPSITHSPGKLPAPKAPAVKSFPWGGAAK